MKNSLTNYIGQAFLIIFSVVLGLYLSERIEERKNNNEADKLLNRIKLEVKENKRIVDEWTMYHVDVVNTLDSLMETESFIQKFISDETAIYQAFSRGTLMNETPANDAWDIAKANPLVVSLDYEILLALSKIYRQQESTYALVPDLVHLMQDPNFNSADKAKYKLKQFRNQLQEIAGREISLMTFYREGAQILGLEDSQLSNE